MLVAESGMFTQLACKWKGCMNIPTQRNVTIYEYMMDVHHFNVFLKLILESKEGREGEKHGL